MTTSIKPQNLVLILSDEHNPRVLGCAGHPEIHTPHLDALARRGTRFDNANCASPICVPARAALATGRNIFETGYWDNVDAYDGKTPSWHHVLRAAGHEVVSIGKLHYRGWAGDDYGFSQSLLPMHIHGGRGEVKMLLRNPPAQLGDGSNMLNSAQAGESDYTRYDESIVAQAVDWLGAQAQHSEPAKPWVLMVSLVAPHFPLTVPEQFFHLYAQRELQMPKAYAYGVDPSAHPFVQQYSQISGYNLHFKDASDVRRALAGYYGLVSYLDHHVGRLMHALSEFGLSDNTRVIYTSDHGDNAGARGLWGKSTMYKESVGVPLIISGAGVNAGQLETAAVSHIDLYNTVLDCVGHDLKASTASARSESLLRPLDAERVALAEYHTIGSKSAAFMLQNQHSKYVHYLDFEPELFDLDTDPQELNSLDAAHHAPAFAGWESALRELLSPEQADQQAKQRQQELIDLYGGETAIRQGQAMGSYTPTPAA